MFRKFSKYLELRSWKSLVYPIKKVVEYVGLVDSWKFWKKGPHLMYNIIIWKSSVVVAVAKHFSSWYFSLANVAFQFSDEKVAPDFTEKVIAITIKNSSVENRSLCLKILHKCNLFFWKSNVNSRSSG